VKNNCHYRRALREFQRGYVRDVMERANRNVKRHTFERLNDLIAAAARRRITYKELIA